MKLFDIQKYIRKNPPQNGTVIRTCDGFFTFAVVIPMLNENDNAETFFANLLHAIQNSSEKIIIITVVNCHEKSPDEYKSNNHKLLKRLNNNEFQIPNLAVFDCSSDGKTLKNGVGEARKTGMDYALSLFDTTDFENSIIASLDADTVIDKNYFNNIRKNFNLNQDCGALTFNVKHLNDAENPAAVIQYEKYLQSYREGLEFAGSPYAFLTVGSAFAVRASSYIHAGGLRKLKAGEDFYFLQSAAKCSKVKHCPDITVRPSARYSPRVPFGTGTALQAITDNQKEFLPFPQYSFETLKKIIASATDTNLITAETFLAVIPENCRQFFEQHNFCDDWSKVTENMPVSQLRAAFLLHWFDGLKTLQFLKYITFHNCI